MKKYVIIGLPICFLIILGIYYLGTPSQPYFATNNPKSFHTIHFKDTKPQWFQAEVKNIFQEATKGRLNNVPFVVGKTEINQVIDQWGKSTYTTTVDNFIYDDYTKQNITVGYTDTVIRDIRSYEEELNQIHLKDILNYKGEPDETHYYKDEKYDQVILEYHIDAFYNLKWILPKPTDKDPNPTVHHISLVSNNHLDSVKQIDSMTLEEKIGQMIISGIYGTKMTANTQSLIRDYQVGGVIFYPENITDVDQTMKLINEIKEENAENKIPLFLSVDQEGGRVTRLPGNLEELPTNQAIGDINDPELSYKIGQILGEQLSAFGLNLNFAPVLDIDSNPDNPVINNRSFGDNPTVVKELGIQTMKGIRSKNVISVVKHFPGHGDTSVDSHLELPTVNKSIQELYSLELKPFIHAIKEGADAVMIAHILLPELDSLHPATLSHNIITDLLRNDLNFDGLIVTDDMTMDAIENNYELGEAAVQSIKAGSDMILVAHEYHNVTETIKSVKQAVQTGEITEERIDESVSRILALKESYKINDNPKDSIDIKSLNELIKKTLP
ncbi:beta-N-acetylhexosaminidase [Oceanobacillus limi]|uniref:beta-N-acetylhexosaminidase n=1 Tax=Oceanobacillus limi TaxID=930131 RepID=A0A1I0B903_9BACI|nr:beta-N-acetylhexosaminidase [Oceanobacillus limi]SET03194.1 beta-N-acetylhexosaminidase [Oceanobacillus limi]